MNSPIPGAIGIELGSIMRLRILCCALGFGGSRGGICTAALEVNLAEKSRVYTTFTFAHPKAYLCYTTVVCSSSLLTILVKAKHQHLYL